VSLHLSKSPFKYWLNVVVGGGGGDISSGSFNQIILTD
jgi:hypothetical protein